MSQRLENLLQSPYFWVTLAVALALLRAPGLLFEPRLFAEEASIYLAYSRHHSALATLLLVPTADGPAGYMMLATNLVMALGKALPLELVPRLTSLAALFIQLTPVLAILWSRGQCWPTAPARVAAMLVLSLSPALDPEVWLTTLHAPIYLALAAAILLVADPPSSTSGRWAARLSLFFGAATGAYTTLLLPAFFWRSWQNRDREYRIQLGCVAAPALLQAIVYSLVRFGLETAPARPWPAWETLATSVAVHHLGRGYFGAVAADFLAQLTGLLPALGPAGTCSPEHLRLAGLVSLLLLGSFFTLAAREQRARLLLLALASSCALPALLAYGVPRGRYAVVAGVLAGLFASVLATAAEGSRRRLVARGLLVFVIATGAACFRWDPPQQLRGGTYLSLDPPRAARPDWAAEVAAWREQPSRGLRVWPYTNDAAWTFFLRSESSTPPIAVAAKRAQLISLGPKVSRELFRIPPRPFAFKVVTTVSAQTDGAIEIELQAIGPQGEIAGVAPLGRLGKGERRTLVVDPQEFQWQKAPTLITGFDAAIKATPAGRLTFETTRIEEIVVGLFDRR